MILSKLRNLIKEIYMRIIESNRIMEHNNKLLNDNINLFQKNNMIIENQFHYLCSHLLTNTDIESFLLNLKLFISKMTPNNPALYGYKIFSQFDEDGIISYILRHISERTILSKSFVEFGCGNGLENNTHALLLDGFSGCWIDGNANNTKFIEEQLGSLLQEKLRLKLFSRYVTLENIDKILAECIDFLRTADIDFLSMDLDGNDWYFMKQILSYTKPKMICVEYNGKFIPPIKKIMVYNPNHIWAGNDYYGASLAAWIDLLSEYTLVSCNLTGVNAFFVRNEFAGLFPTYSVEKLYQPPRYELARLYPNHPASFEWLKQSQSVG